MKKSRIQARIQEEYYKALELYAKAHGYKISALVRIAIVDLLRKRGVDYALQPDTEISGDNRQPEKDKS